MLRLDLVMFGALCGLQTADAAAPLQQRIVITPSSGCGLLTAYTAGTGLPAWSSPAPSCGAGAFTLAFNQGNTPPPAALSRYGGVGMAGSALLSAWSARSVPDGARVGYQITAPPGITINNVGLRRSASCRTSPTAVGGSASLTGTAALRTCIRTGPRSTRLPPVRWTLHATGGSSCGASQRCARGQGRSSSAVSPCTRPRRRARASPRLPTPPACGTRPEQASGSGTRQVTPWPLPVPGRIRRAFVVLSVQAGASAPIADPSLPGPN